MSDYPYAYQGPPGRPPPPPPIPPRRPLPPPNMYGDPVPMPYKNELEARLNIASTNVPGHSNGYPQAGGSPAHSPTAWQNGASVPASTVSYFPPPRPPLPAEYAQNTSQNNISVPSPYGPSATPNIPGQPVFNSSSHPHNPPSPSHPFPNGFHSSGNPRPLPPSPDQPHSQHFSGDQYRLSQFPAHSQMSPQSPIAPSNPSSPQTPHGPLGAPDNHVKQPHSQPTPDPRLGRSSSPNQNFHPVAPNQSPSNLSPTIAGLGINALERPRRKSVPGSRSPSQSVPQSPANASPSEPVPNGRPESVDEVTQFMYAARDRVWQVLLQEKALALEGRYSEIFQMLGDLMDNEIRLRQERYKMHMNHEQESESASCHPSAETSLSRHGSGTSITASLNAGNQSPASKSPPPSTFSDILSQTPSYVNPPRTPAPPTPAPDLASTTMPTNPLQGDPEPPQAPPKIHLQEIKTEVKSKPQPFKEHPIPPIPKSDELAVLLSQVSKFEDPDPLLQPLRDRLITLKDLQWIEIESSEFEDREAKITEKLTEQATANQQNHLKRQSVFLTQSNWEFAEREQRAYEEGEKRTKEADMKQSLARWRKEYCDPSYERLHGVFARIGDLHREITQLQGCVKVEEQVQLLEETQSTYLAVMAELDLLTDQLRQKQHELKIHVSSSAGDWEMISKFEKEKKIEDTTLADQRAEFKLDKIHLHARCVKYLIETGLDTLDYHKSSLETELKKIMDSLPEAARRSALPHENSKDAYPSKELIEQFKAASLVLDIINRRINQLYSQLEQSDLNVITEEASPEINKAHNNADWAGAEALQSLQQAKQKQRHDTNSNDQKSRDEANLLFNHRLSEYIAAYMARK